MLPPFFQAVNEVYKSVILIHEANREFKKLSDIHLKVRWEIENKVFNNFLEFWHLLENLLK